MLVSPIQLHCVVTLMLPHFGRSATLQIEATNTDTFDDINTQRHDRGENASTRMCTACGSVGCLVQGDRDGCLFLVLFFTLEKMGRTTAILAPTSSFPSQLAQTQVAFAHAVEQSIPSAQVTSLQSAQLFLPAL